MGASSSSSSSDHPGESLELVYFDIAGVAEKVRLAFSLGHVPFTNTKVAFDEWASIKPTTPFGQLPILKIGSDTTIAQSDAMLRYAGTLAQNKGIDLYPQDKLLQIEEALGMTNDIGRDLRPCIYLAMNPTKAGGYPESFKGTPENAELVKNVRTAFMTDDFVKYMSKIEAKLESNGNKFIAGTDTPTIADCALVPQLKHFTKGVLDHVPTTCLDEYKNIKAYIDKFMNLPEVAAWYANNKK